MGRGLYLTRTGASRTPSALPREDTAIARGHEFPPAGWPATKTLNI
jgi:hypothetical protein